MNPVPPQTALIATQRRQTEPGLCTCGAPGYEDCACVWGRLVRDLIAIGWFTPPSDAANLLARNRTRIDSLIVSQRARLLIALAESYPGTREEFMSEYGVGQTTYYKLGLRVPKDRRKTI